MNCCGGHGGHKESEGGNHPEHKTDHQGGCGGSKLSYLIIGLIILLGVIFALKYLK